MRRGFFVKLAFTNIRKNGQSYYPYLISCICTVMMFYIMHALSQNKGLFEMYGAAYIIQILGMGSVIVGIFSMIFLFYTNSFLIKRRKKELGLYNILGLEKKHIGKMMFCETFFAAVSSIIIGLGGGMLLYKLAFMLLLKLLNFHVPLTFSLPPASAITTIGLFLVIFTVSLLYNLGQVHLANPVELLRGGSQGEKEPKVKWVLVVIGVLSLGAGYAIALLIESPLQALIIFFVAVILVMIGTYALFTAGSIALLKALKKNKKYYYKISHFTSVSGMMYRMKQNAVGLANICVLCTGILIMISTTVSFYIGQEDLLRTRYPKDVMISCDAATDENIDKIQKLAADFQTNSKVKVSDLASCRQSVLMASRETNRFQLDVDDSADYNTITASYMLYLMPLEDYNENEGEKLALDNDEVYIIDTDGTFREETLIIDGNSFQVKKILKPGSKEENMMASMVGGYFYIVVKDMEVLEQITAADSSAASGITYYLEFNADGNRKDILEAAANLNAELNEQVPETSLESLEEGRESFLTLYGGLFFLGIFLGLLFMMATTLIIYYKQVSEGYEDKERFEIMQKVGMSKQEVKKAIKSQIVMVFSLPLITSVIHIAVAFKLIMKILAVLNMTNVMLYFICTVITITVFSIAYRIVYGLTARTYYKIVG